MILNGKEIAAQLRQELKEKVEALDKRPPCLAVLLAGEDPASAIYVGKKIQACEEVGIASICKKLPASISEEALLEEIDTLNGDSSVDGILVQLPLPGKISEERVMERILPEKDVDGFHPVNLGKLLTGRDDGLVPCTPLGISRLLEHAEVETAGKNALILGRSAIVGKPMAALLMRRGKGGDATVTVAHSKTKNLPALCQTADILIAAIGIPRFVKPEMVREGAVVIDVGINRVEAPENKKGYRIVGDVDYEAVREKCRLITPVPGGVGPMTIAMLLHNTWQCFRY